MANGLAIVFAWLLKWSVVISGLGSLALTAGLVVLYRRQNSIQEDQQDILRRELNREVRQGHTETLRKRIRAWHGDIDEFGVSKDGAWFTDETNLPKVQGASVAPAPPIIESVGNEPKFRVVPEAIEDDRYLQDLLKNHADDLQRLKADIERQYNEFDNAKSAFLEACSGGTTIETSEYTLEPRPEFGEWLFEQAVLLNRQHRGRGKEKMKDIAESRLTGRNSGNVEKGMQFFSASGVKDRGPSTYTAIAKSGDFDDLREHEEDIEAQLVEIHQKAIDETGDGDFYDSAVEAAGVLDEMEESVEELKAKLVEHEGHPIYLEDCEYLEEVTL